MTDFLKSLDLPAKPLLGRKALVTGASIGIGQGIAEEFARQGADVVFCYFRPPDGVETGRLIEGHFRKSVHLEADLTRPERCEEVVALATRELDGLDLLVNNAGITIYAEIEQAEISTFDALFNLNVRAYFLMCKHAMPHLKQARGTVVNIGSIQAFGAVAPGSLYAATKGAVNAFTHTLAIEVAHAGVRVNAVAPGMTETPRYFDDPGYSREAAGKMVPDWTGGIAARYCSDGCFSLFIRRRFHHRPNVLRRRWNNCQVVDRRVWSGLD